MLLNVLDFSPTMLAGAENHLKTGGKRVVISAPTTEADKVKTIVMGVNYQLFHPAKDLIVFNTS